MLSIDYNTTDRRAVIKWEPSDETAPWLCALCRLTFDGSEDTTQEDAWRVSMPWWSFVTLRRQIFELFTGYGLSIGKDFAIGDMAADCLRRSNRAIASYETARENVTIAPEELQGKLREIGFTRELSREQIRNVCRLAAIPAAASFSVPGAGKTTEALACFFFRALPDARLLVVAPKNAFASWEEQLTDCMPTLGGQFIRLRGGRDNIIRILDADARFMLINYQQLALIPDVIAAHCARHPIHVFLDESHRIKSGVAKQTARAVLGLSHLPVGKLILSGTPMPQSVDDLIPQLAFLYPELPSTSENVVELIKPVFVRTTKIELGLPPVTYRPVNLRMAPLQGELYRLMKFEVAREAATALNLNSKQAFRSLGRSVARLLQFVSNPALLSSEIGFAHPDLMAAVLAEGEGPKLRYILQNARNLARDNRKVLIWSSFVRNVEYIATRLADVGAVYIHGGVDTGDENDDETREGKIKLFHDDPNIRVMVANPAAAGEGISLHRICHHAFYLDRTFNAAHYLQSEDRIHRFGLARDQVTIIQIVECLETVDETVRERLNYKIGAMAAALNDPSLHPDPIPLDPTDIDDGDEYSTGLCEEDIRALLKDIAKEEG